MSSGKPTHLHLDYEWFCNLDITESGIYRCAFDPYTEIICAAMAFGNEEPVAWWKGMSDSELAALDPYWDALEDPSVLVYAHNGQFEYAMSQALMWKTWGIRPPHISRFRCTASLARRAALPAKLERLGDFLGTVIKDKAGSRLIKKFAMLQKPDKVTKKRPFVPPERQVPYRIRPEDDWDDFMRFVDYCKQDVRAEQEVARRLAYFDEPINNKNYTLHEVINERGVTVNIPALRHAQKLIDEETAIVSKKFRELTGLEVTQGAKVLAWAQANGYDRGDLQAATVEAFLEEEVEAKFRYIIHPESSSAFWESTDTEAGTDGCAEHVTREQYDSFCAEEGIEASHPPVELVRTALQLRASISYAAIKKVQTMLDCVGPDDNRIRGMLNAHGATTGRSTNSLVQFQNMKRPTIDNSEAAYREICGGISRDMLELVYGPPLEVISSCVRHFIENI
jgi:DNA polymerase bacteriophage-type